MPADLGRPLLAPERDLAYALDGRIDLRLRVERADREPHTPMERDRIELLVRERGAVQTGGVATLWSSTCLRTHKPPIPIDPINDLCPVKVSTSMFMAFMSMGITRRFGSMDRERNAPLTADAADLRDRLHRSDHIRPVHRSRGGCSGGWLFRSRRVP